MLVREFDPLKNDSSKLAAALPEDVCLVFDMEDSAWKPDKRTKAYKELAKHGFFAEFSTASPEELEGFIKRCFKDRGHDRPRGGRVPDLPVHQFHGGAFKRD